LTLDRGLAAGPREIEGIAHDRSLNHSPSFLGLMSPSQT
jgi:hypothetical protein